MELDETIQEKEKVGWSMANLSCSRWNYKMICWIWELAISRVCWTIPFLKHPRYATLLVIMFRVKIMRVKRAVWMTYLLYVCGCDL